MIRLKKCEPRRRDSRDDTHYRRFAFVPAPCPIPKLDEVLAAPSATNCKLAAQVSMHVLVAEDDRTNQIVARVILKSVGCTVNIVADGRAAVEAVATASYDVVLMDMQMPIMGGCEAARQLRAMGYTVPIVALTASTLAEEQAACLAAGMDEVLMKPLERGALVAMLGRSRGAERRAR
jgi:CheY-like chemotaxis protein